MGKRKLQPPTKGMVLRKHTHSRRPKNKTPNAVAKKHYESFFNGASPRNLITGFIINPFSGKSSKTVTEHGRNDQSLNNSRRAVKL